MYERWLIVFASHLTWAFRDLFTGIKIVFIDLRIYKHIGSQMLLFISVIYSCTYHHFPFSRNPSFIFAFPPYCLQQNTRKMKFEGFEPIFGEPKAEWANSRLDSLGRFLFHVSAPDSSHLLIQVTDFHSNTWEAKRSVLQVDDMVIFFLFLYIGFVLYFVVREIYMNWFIEAKKKKNGNENESF